jgi:hypothetical protein
MGPTALSTLAKFIPDIAAVNSINVMKNPIGDDGLATLMVAIKGTAVKTITGLVEGQISIGYSNQELEPMDVKTLAADIEFSQFSAALNEITLSSPGSPLKTIASTGPRTYTLKGLQGGADPNVDLSSKNLGPADLQFLSTVFTSFPEFTAAMNSLNLSNNNCFRRSQDNDGRAPWIDDQTGWIAICKTLKGNNTIETLVLCEIGARPVALSTLANAISDMAALSTVNLRDNKFIEIADIEAMKIAAPNVLIEH